MNSVSLVGRISDRGVRLEYTPERAKPQLNFALTVMERGRDGISRPTFIPCMVVSDNAERLAEILEPHDLIAIPAGKLQWKAGRTKEGGKLQVVTFNVEVLDASSPVDERSEPGEGDSTSVGEIVAPGPTERATATKARRPRVPKMAQQAWDPAHAN